MLAAQRTRKAADILHTVLLNVVADLIHLIVTVVHIPMGVVGGTAADGIVRLILDEIAVRQVVEIFANRRLPRQAAHRRDGTRPLLHLHLTLVVALFEVIAAGQHIGENAGKIPSLRVGAVQFPLHHRHLPPILCQKRQNLIGRSNHHLTLGIEPLQTLFRIQDGACVQFLVVLSVHKHQHRNIGALSLPLHEFA